jgi:TRAP-type mannitol/chloroaromatic compound transport system permease small subunit
MRALLAFTQGVDWFNDRFGKIAEWCVLLACVISAGNASIRYLFDMSSNAWLEIQWWLFAGIFLLGASQTLRLNEHVRVDILYGNVPKTAQLWIDTIGILVFLLPSTVLLVYLSWPIAMTSYRIGESSSNAGGLILWPVKFLLPLGFALLTLQGVAELIKRIAALLGDIDFDTHYEKPLQ